MLDYGISSIEDIENNKNICSYNILATETMTSLDNIEEIFKKYDSNKLVVSIDIKNNELLVNNKDIDLEDVIYLINKYKPKYTIILNISYVGTKKGVNTNIIEEITKKIPHTKCCIAGGIRNSDIETYTKKNINNFLIGTLLHEGNLSYKLYMESKKNEK